MALNLKPDLYLLSFPVEIINSDYKRGSFEFNFGFIVGEEVFNSLHLRIMAEQVLRKMAYMLTSLELELAVLSKSQTQFMQPFIEEL